MQDNKEDALDRLTVAGWLLLVVLGAIFAVLVPLLLFKVCPAVLEAGGRTTRYGIVATFMALGWPTFLLSGRVLEQWGITIVRPPQSETSSGR